MAKEEKPRKRGLIQVYTGSGKGKTTAAWGQAVRAVGHGWKVAVVQFLKPRTSGEFTAAERLSPNLAVFGCTRPYDPRVDQRKSTELRDDSRRNFEIAKDIISSGVWDLVVLDEINIALHYDFISRDEMLDLLSARPEHVEIVLTGRYAPDWLINAADLVTEMAAVKHPAEQGTEAHKGIEY